MTVYENMLLLEERVKKAAAYMMRLRAENDALKRDIKLITAHNEELQAYVELSVDDLEAAEQFSSIGGDAVDIPEIDMDIDL